MQWKLCRNDSLRSSEGSELRGSGSYVISEKQREHRAHLSTVHMANMEMDKRIPHGTLAVMRTQPAGPPASFPKRARSGEHQRRVSLSLRRAVHRSVRVPSVPAHRRSCGATLAIAVRISTHGGKSELQEYTIPYMSHTSIVPSNTTEV